MRRTNPGIRKKENYDTRQHGKWGRRTKTASQTVPRTILLCQDEKEAVGSQTSYFQRKYARHKGDAIPPVPRSQTNSVGDGPATQVIRAMEIEDRIESQKAEMAKTMLNVMKIMDFLPTDSTERSMLEYRHIDCLSWKQVCKEANMTRTPCNKYYNAGIDKLLTYKKVQSILQEFASSQEPSKP